MSLSTYFKITTVIIFILLGLLTIQNAYGDAIARYGGEFMAAGAGAKSLAMGGTYASQHNGVWSLFLNPASLKSNNFNELGLMHSERFTGVVDYSAAAFTLSQNSSSFTTLGFIRLGVNGIPFTRLEDSSLPLEEQSRVEITKVVNEAEYAFFVAKNGNFSKYQWSIVPKLIFKHFGSDYRAYGLGVDAGIYSQPIDNVPFYAGLSMRDVLGTVIAWEQTGRKEVIVPTVRMGTSYTLVAPSLDAKITPAVDVDLRTEAFSTGKEFSVFSGLEFLVNDIVALRGGMNDERLTLGGGFALRAFTLDYAWIGHDDLGESHRVSVLFRWN